MMEAKLPTIAGMVTGFVTNVLTGNLLATVGVALLTGAFAYIGQQIMKHLHEKFKK